MRCAWLLVLCLFRSIPGRAPDRPGSAARPSPRVQAPRFSFASQKRRVTFSLFTPSQSVSQSVFTVPPRAHPSTGSTLCPATRRMFKSKRFNTPRFLVLQHRGQPLYATGPGVTATTITAAAPGRANQPRHPRPHPQAHDSHHHRHRPRVHRPRHHRHQQKARDRGHR